MNFRVSPTEKELIETRIKLTGMLKSKFFIQSCLYQTILVKGNIKTFTEIKKQIEQISKQINKNPNLEELEPEQVESLRIILEILNTLFRKEQMLRASGKADWKKIDKIPITQTQRLMQVHCFGEGGFRGFPLTRCILCVQNAYLAIILADY